MKPVAIYYRMMSYQEDNLALLNEIFYVVSFDNPGQDTDEALASAAVLFAPLGYKTDAQKMDRCPGLVAIASNTTGVPHIDMAAASSRDIAVCALHDEAVFLDQITPTAEHAIGLMLAGWRRIPAAHNAASKGEWSRWPWGAPAMLSRLRLGLVGYGRLGQKVGEIARAFGMDVAFYDPAVTGSMPDILSLAERSDILSLHAVANDSTRNLVNREVLSVLPRGAMVVNTARGELLDTEALLELLESRYLRCAALDVVDGEFEPGFGDCFGSSRLAMFASQNDNLILTPHIGGSTLDAWRETERRVIEKAADVVRRRG